MTLALSFCDTLSALSLSSMMLENRKIFRVMCIINAEIARRKEEAENKENTLLVVLWRI